MKTEEENVKQVENELSPEAQKMFDEMDATFDDDTLIDRIKPAK